MLARVRSSESDTAGVLSALDDAVRLAARLGNRGKEALALKHLAADCRDDGQYARAVPLYERLTEIAREVVDPKTELYAVEQRALTLTTLGRFDEADVFYAEATRLQRESGSPAGDPALLLGRGVEADARLVLDAANEFYGTALSVAKAMSSAASEHYALAGACVGPCRSWRHGRSARALRTVAHRGRGRRPGHVRQDVAGAYRPRGQALHRSRVARAGASANQSRNSTTGTSYADATLSWALFAQGRLPESIEAIDKARAELGKHESWSLRFHVDNVEAAARGLVGVSKRDDAAVDTAIAKFDELQARAARTGDLQNVFWVRYARAASSSFGQVDLGRARLSARSCATRSEAGARCSSSGFAFRVTKNSF